MEGKEKRERRNINEMEKKQETLEYKSRVVWKETPFEEEA